jgi:hypothetical protein
MKTYAELWEQCAQAGLAVSMDHTQINELWGSFKRTLEQQKATEKEIEKAVITGELKAVILLRDPSSEGGHRKLPVERWRLINDCSYGHSFVSYEIHRDDFQGWLKRTAKWPLPDDCLLSFWWRTKAQVDEAAKGRREQQIDEIVRIAKSMGYDLKAIPDGGKAAIKMECLKDKRLFTLDGFLKAWKAAKKPPYEYIQIENLERYMPR